MRLGAILLVLAQTTFFSETVEVRVTNVDVVVTAKDGKPVGGLTRDDFEIYEDGVKKEISHFAEVTEEKPVGALVPVPVATQPAAPAPKTEDRRRRNITVFVDDATVTASNRNQVLPELRRFLQRNVRPGDSVMLASWSSGLTIVREPTSDIVALQDALDDLEKRTARAAGFDERERFQRSVHELISMYRSRVPPETPPYSSALALGAGYANSAAHAMRQKAEAFKSLLAAHRGLDGRKIVVVLTQSFATNPGEDAFLYLDSLRDAFAADTSRNALLEARAYELPRLVEEVAAAANSAGVTLYPIEVSGKFGDLGSTDASQTIRVASQPMARAQTSGMTLRSLAAETGGVATAGTSNWQLAFDTIASDLATYYSLGYRSDGPRQDRMRRIEVRLKNKKLAVRTRNAIVEQTASAEMSDAVAANLFRAASSNDLGVRAAAAAAQPNGENLLIPLTITIPTGTLTLGHDGADVTGSFSVFAAFLRNDGAVSRVARQTHQFRFPAESLPRRKEITVKLDVTADARTGGISVGVMDEASRATGFASVKVP